MEKYVNENGFELKKIIIEYCMPDVDDSFWYDLNENSKLTLNRAQLGVFTSIPSHLQ